MNTITWPVTNTAEYEEVTIRAGAGKAHRAFRVTEESGRRYIVCSCTCPGSNNGRLVNRARVIAEGWKAVNCGN